MSRRSNERITSLCLLTHQLFTFHDSLSMDRRKPVHFTTMKFSCNSPSPQAINSTWSHSNCFLYSPLSSLPLLKVCWNVHALWAYPLNTRHFVPPVATTTHFWFSRVRQESLLLNSKIWNKKIARKYFNWKSEEFPHVRKSRGKQKQSSSWNEWIPR